MRPFTFLAILALSSAPAALGCNNLIGAEDPEVLSGAPGEDSDGESGSEAHATCGNGVVETGEACDDGNDIGGDGCAACSTDCAAANEFPDTVAGRCYRIGNENVPPVDPSDTPRAWDDAETDCESWGGTLAAVTSADELASIQNRVRADTWIGGNDPNGTGMFEWVTGEPWEFASWAEARPASTIRSCVLISGDLLAFWDADCDDLKAYVCERALAGSP